MSLGVSLCKHHVLEYKNSFPINFPWVFVFNTCLGVDFFVNHEQYDVKAAEGLFTDWVQTFSGSLLGNTPKGKRSLQMYSHIGAMFANVNVC